MKKILVCILILIATFAMAEDKIGLWVGNEIGSSDVTNSEGNFGFYTMPFVGYAGDYFDSKLDFWVEARFLFGLAGRDKIKDKNGKETILSMMDTESEVYYNLFIKDSILSFGGWFQYWLIFNPRHDDIMGNKVTNNYFGMGPQIKYSYCFDENIIWTAVGMPIDLIQYIDSDTDFGISFAVGFYNPKFNIASKILVPTTNTKERGLRIASQAEFTINYFSIYAGAVIDKINSDYDITILPFLGVKYLF